MAPRTVLCVALLAIGCASLAAAAGPCDGPSSKIRYQFMYKLKPGSSPVDVTAAAKAFLDGCRQYGLVRYGAGPSLTTKPEAFGNPSKGSEYDFGAWSDWASVDQIKRCHEESAKSGTLGKLRAFAERSSRAVFEMPKQGAGNPAAQCASAASTAPATVRYLLAYKFPGDRPTGATPEVCAKVNALQAQIASSKSGDWVRAGRGCDVVPDDLAVFNVKNTADFGSFMDFKDLASLTRFLTDGPATAGLRNASRALATDAMRVAIALDGAATDAAAAPTAAATTKPAAAATTAPAAATKPAPMAAAPMAKPAPAAGATKPAPK